jgi:hypothetical protein
MFTDPVAALDVPGQPPLVLTRGVWAGGQRHGVVLWSSDIHSTFEQLASMVPQGVHASMSGIPYWSAYCWGWLGALVAVVAGILMLLAVALLYRVLLMVLWRLLLHQCVCLAQLRAAVQRCVRTMMFCYNFLIEEHIGSTYVTLVQYSCTYSCFLFVGHA